MFFKKNTIKNKITSNKNTEAVILGRTRSVGRSRSKTERRKRKALVVSSRRRSEKFVNRCVLQKTVTIKFVLNIKFDLHTSIHNSGGRRWWMFSIAARAMETIFSLKLNTFLLKDEQGGSGGLIIHAALYTADKFAGTNS